MAERDDIVRQPDVYDSQVAHWYIKDLPGMNNKLEELRTSAHWNSMRADWKQRNLNSEVSSVYKRTFEQDNWLLRGDTVKSTPELVK